MRLTAVAVAVAVIRSITKINIEHVSWN